MNLGIDMDHYEKSLLGDPEFDWWLSQTGLKERNVVELRVCNESGFRLRITYIDLDGYQRDLAALGCRPGLGEPFPAEPQRVSVEEVVVPPIDARWLTVLT